MSRSEESQVSLSTPGLPTLYGVGHVTVEAKVVGMDWYVEIRNNRGEGVSFLIEPREDAPGVACLVARVLAPEG